MEKIKYKLVIVFCLAAVLSSIYFLNHVFAATNVGVNLSTDGSLTVDGALKFTSEAANNYILSTDASGNATWISVGAALGNSDTDSLPQGAINKYYSNAAVDARIDAQKGVVSGLAALDGAGKVPSGQLPAIVLNNSYAVATIEARDALIPAPGDVAIVTDDGYGVSRSYVWDNIGSTWLELLTPLSLYLTKENNLLDLADPDIARLNLGIGNVTNDAQIKASTFTNNGDLIYGTGTGTYSRLGVGSDGQVLTLNNGAPSWAPQTPVCINTGDAKTCGAVVMNPGTGNVTILTTAVLSTSLIFITNNITAGNSALTAKITARVPGTSFTITSQGGDSSTYAWLIINP